MLSVIMLSVIMLSVVMLNVVTSPIMLSVIMLNVVMLSVVMLNVVMPSVVAPLSGPIVIFEEKKFYDLRAVRQRPRRKHLGQAGGYHQGLLQKPSRGQYYKPFYGRDLFCIVIS
jgi:hypothetical protein